MKKLLVLLLLPVLTMAQYEESDWEWRDTWMRVPELFSLAEIKTGQTVADIGCHEGYLSIHLAKRVGELGKVYAVDINSSRLATLKENAKTRKLSNIEAVLGASDDPKLPQETLDVVVVMDTYHEITAYQTVLEHINKALKPGGRLLIMEKLKDRAKGKSRQAHVNAHSMAPKYVKKELKAAGFTVIKEVKDFGQWKEEADKQMWIVVAEK